MNKITKTFIVIVMVVSAHAYGQFMEKMGDIVTRAKNWAMQAQGKLENFAPSSVGGSLSNLRKKLTKFATDKNFRNQVIASFDFDMKGQLIGTQKKIMELADNPRLLKQVMGKLSSLNELLFERNITPEVQVSQLQTPAQELVSRLADDSVFREEFISSLTPVQSKYTVLVSDVQATDDEDQEDLDE